MHPAAEKIIAEEAAKEGLRPSDLFGAHLNPRFMKARDICLKRLRNETQLSLPQIGRIFGLSHSTVWTAINSKCAYKFLNADTLIRRMWGHRTICEIAVEVGITAETVRKAGHRLGLGPAYKRPAIKEGHRAFTPRCAEILREHGVRL